MADESPTVGEKPFAEQFRYHLKDIPPITMQNRRAKEGSCHFFLHVPTSAPIKVTFDPDSTIEEILPIVSEKISINFSRYHFVSNEGIINQGATLVSHGIHDGSHVILVHKFSKSMRISQAMRPKSRIGPLTARKDVYTR